MIDHKKYYLSPHPFSSIRSIKKKKTLDREIWLFSKWEPLQLLGIIHDVSLVSLFVSPTPCLCLLFFLDVRKQPQKLSVADGLVPNHPKGNSPGAEKVSVAPNK